MLEAFRARFDNSNACISLVEVARVCLSTWRASRMLVEVPRVRFDNRKACSRFVEVR